MGRPRLPEGPRRTLGAKFTLNEIARIDTERGDASRTELIRSRVLGVPLEAASVPVSPRPASRHEVARAALSSAAYRDPGPSESCPHPAASVDDFNVCGECHKELD